MKKAVKIKTLDNEEIKLADPATLTDPLNVNGRLYRAMSTLLDTFEEMTVREQVATVSAIARIQVLFIKLREEKYDTGSAGTALKRYEKAFAANAARRRKGVSRSSIDGLLIDDSDDTLEY